MAREFDLIRRYFARPTPSAILGPGDDGALLQPSPGQQLVVSTDMLVAGTHFFPDTPPDDLGWKTLAVNVSDLAAMGATPRWATLAASLPEADENWIAAFAAGFFACAHHFGLDVVGGDTTQGPLNFCVTVLGEVPPGAALRRSGASLSDDIWVSGQPGLAALGLRFLQQGIELPDTWKSRCLSALHRPHPRVDLGLALRGKASAAIDVSDGLLADLGHIAEASGLMAELSLDALPALPEGVDHDTALACQLAGGDDYELCFTAAPSQRETLTTLAALLALPLTRIGRMCPLSDSGVAGQDSRPTQGAAPTWVRILGPDGEKRGLGARGYEHFHSPRSPS